MDKRFDMPLKKQPAPIPKISVKICRPFIHMLDQKVENACLRRDAYLSKVLEAELSRLDEEVSIPNSEDSRKFVAERLDLLDRKLVSLALRSELTARLDDICERKRIVRDAFFNRLFLLLAAPPKLLDALLFAEATAQDWRYKVWSEDRNEGPFYQNGFYPLAPVIDPFWALRAGIERCIEVEAEDYIEPTSGKKVRVTRDLTGAPMPLPGVYTTVFVKDKLLGMNCYMPDWHIPGHDAQKEVQAKTDELLAELDAL